MGDVLTKQDEFAKRYDIPFVPIPPKITEYSLINNNTVISKRGHFQCRDRYFIFTIGVVAWEFTYQISENEVNEKEILDTTINDTNLFNNAILHKQAMCGASSLCRSCQERNLHLAFIGVTHDRLKSFFVAKDEVEAQFSVELIPFVIKSTQRVLFRHLQHFHFASPDKTTNKNQYSSFIWTSLAWFVIKQYGKDMISTHLADIPQKRDFGDPEEFDTALNRFIDSFCYVYFWLHPNFILDKEHERMGIQTLELNSFLYSYRQMFDKDFWSDYSTILTGLGRTNFLVSHKLYDLLAKVPRNLLQELMKQMNPFQFPFQSFDTIFDSFDEVDQEVMWALADHTLTSLTPSVQTHLASLKSIAVSATKIRRLTPRYKANSHHEKTVASLDKLCRLGMVTKVDPSDVDKPIRSTKAYYHLNPDFPYTRIFLFQFQS